MPAANLIRRHPYLTLGSLGTIALALWIGYFLATFDLNDYRADLAAELGRRLGMPVHLGEANLELREGGIAFHFSRVEIGSAATATELQAEDLWLQLAWHGLILRRPIFTEIALDRPRLRFAIPPAAPPGAVDEDKDSSLELLRGFQVHRVEVNHGNLDLGWTDQSGQSRSLRLHDLTVNLGELGWGGTVTFDVDGRLPGPAHRDARLVWSGSVGLAESGSWREAEWDFSLEGENLDAAQIAGLLPFRIQAAVAGMADLQLFVKGRLDTTVTVQAEASGRGLSIRPGVTSQQSIPVKHLQVAGTWQQQGETHRVRQLAMQLDDLRLAGEFSLSSDLQGTTIEGELGTSTLPLDTLRRWLPPGLQEQQPLLTRLQPGGNVLLDHATWRVTVPAAPQDAPSFVIETLNAEARQLAWSIGQQQTARLTDLAVHLADGRWRLSSDSGTIASVPVAFSGTITTTTAAPPQLAFELNSSIPAEQLPALWPEALPAELTLAGPLQLNGHLQGTPALMTFEVAGDLAQLDLHYGEQVHLPATPGSRLTVQGTGNLHGVDIADARLDLPPLKGQLSATIDWSEALTVRGAGRLELTDLTAAHPLAPALAKLQLRGGVALEVGLDESAGALQPKLSLTLHDVAIPTHQVVGDITQLRGRLLLDGKRLHSDVLTAQIGSSPVTAKVRVADLAAPQLELDVKSPAVRASDLIFRSRKIILRDLSGHLLIDRDGINFQPVHVRLDNGTRATITGTVRNFSAPQVELDIAGEYANVAEIIQLWSDESPQDKAARQARADVEAGHFPDIHITVQAREGDLYGMQFSNASARIMPRAGYLLLHPLDFHVGAGYCTAQVLIDHVGTVTLLRVSGHVENVDAYAVYNELLERKSIMRGSLRGDFFLEGELGEPGWLATSYGNVNATVRDGVMRHSPMLSTIFSLLNVSQLFKFQLPDINLEGLPFKLLTTELTLDKGVLSTQRLVIDSDAMNMAYAGQYDLIKNQVDLLVVAKPLGTIDKVVTRLPIAGWILGGEEKALITAQFKVTGSGEKPKVEAIPITAISKGVLGIFQRTLGLPLKLIEDPAILWGGGGEKN